MNLLPSKRWVCIGLALGASGCLRVQYDRCDDSPPHPDCVDAAADAAQDSSSAADSDLGVDVEAPDAFADDAPTPPDATFDAAVLKDASAPLEDSAGPEDRDAPTDSHQDAISEDAPQSDTGSSDGAVSDGF